VSGILVLYPEGSELPLLSWKDPNPLQIKFFSFSSYNGRLLEVAFGCKPKDIFSSVANTKRE